jgi:hypothetical protein
LAQTDLSDNAFEEDPEFIAAYEALIREPAAITLKALSMTLITVEHLLGKYGELQQKLRLHRLAFRAFIVAIGVALLLLELLVKPEPEQVPITLILGFVLLVFVGKTLIQPWFDKRLQRLYRTHIKTTIQEYYPLRVRTRFLFAMKNDFDLPR